MSNPVSQSVVQPQPNQAYYGVEALTLFITYTRETYQTAFGMTAPPYDPSRVIKNWFDSSADTSNPGNVSIYKVLSQDSKSNWGLQQMLMPAAEAAAVNLAGAVTYPAYVIAETHATRGGSGINGLYLSLLTEAQTLLTEIGGTSIVDEGATVVFPVIYPPTELRRTWDVVFKGSALNVGMLLAQKYAKGMGAPGHWDLSGPEAVWVPDPPAPTGVDDTRPPRPMPMRDLLPNEVFRTGLMGVGISRIDLQEAVDKAAGAFTPDDRATLQQIYHLVNRLMLS